MLSGNKLINSDKVWEVLGNINDPEIPVISLVELGVIREVDIKDDQLFISLTPTFSACPAIDVMLDEINIGLTELGISNFKIDISLDPPWTSDMISYSGREKLKKIGLAPPSFHSGDINQILIDPVCCPYCDSDNTSLKNSFGPTPCRMIYFCNNCTQPFEQFKPL